MRLVVGQVARPHGLRGEVVVAVRTDDPAGRFAVGSVLATDPAEAGPLTVDGVRPHQDRLVVAFEGVLDRDGAEALRGVLLCVDSADVAPLDDPDEFHDWQLVGLTAVDPAGEKLGEVVRVVHGPAGELLVVRHPAGEALVPFVREIVPAVDVPGGRVVVDPPGGLFEL